MTIKQLLAGVTFTLMAAAASADHVAIFDPQGAVLQTKRAAKVMDTLKKNEEYTALTTQVESLQADLKAMAKEQETKGMTWSQEQSMEHRKKMEYVQADLQLAVKKLQAENSAVMNRLMQESQQNLREILSKLVQTDGIDIVIPAQGVIYANPKSDITAKVAAELDKLDK
ncbi:outer membrane protein [Alteromonadaceae bacterium 2753L.S.0a.02]|nr:outer membrane protein [Alteromonadaceae bacterium 2753L.S.0a.02]